MRILFSPVGNSDPWRNYRDGALLHIVRHYKPEKVILFFTESLWQGNAKAPGSKDYKWDEIISNVSPNSEVQIKINNIEKEHDFDSYKDIFHNYIKEIENSYQDAELLLNVTSGTPQMESTLCLEYITNPINKQCVQVSTPANGSNVIRNAYANPTNQIEDLKIVNDKESSSENRCKFINIISFRETMIRSQIKELVENYDYEATFKLISNQKSFRNGQKLKKNLMKLTNQIKMHEVFDEIKGKYNNAPLEKALFHYLLLKMRYDRQDIAETLIRVKSIAEFISNQYIINKWPNLIIEKDGKPKLNVSENPSFSLKYQNHLETRKQKFKPENYLGLPAYIDILQILAPKSQMLKELNYINNVNSLRNSVAHNLDTIYLEKNKNYRKIQDAVNAINNMLNISYPEIEEVDYRYFENKNEELIELL